MNSNYYLKRFVVMLGMAAASASQAAAQGQPTQIVVPFSPGGATDVVARALGQVMQKMSAARIIIDNKPGAAGIIGVTAVVKAAPDGSMLLLGSNGPIAINPALYPKLPYSLSKDLTAISGLASVPFLFVVNPVLPAKTVAEFVALAKRHPDVMNFASPGVGTTNHLVGELLKRSSGIKMVHVPYKGAALAMTDVVSGQVHFMSGDISTLLPMVQAGRLRALAVTSRKRVQLLPQIPTVEEGGLKNFEALGWFGVFGPSGMKAEVVLALTKRISQAIEEPEFRERLANLGGEPLAISGEEFRGFVDAENQKWSRLIRDNRITKDAP